MQRLYIITMPDGSQWGVPAEIIAADRAKYYSENDPDTTYQEEFDAMIEWFDENDYEFADWAKNNMDWADVANDAVRMPPEPKAVDWEEGWINGEYELLRVVDAREANDA